MHFLCILVTKDFAHADLADADFSQTKIKALTILVWLKSRSQGLGVNVVKIMENI